MISDIVCINPLKNIINSINDKPKWLCNHSEAKITDFEKKKYRCLKCSKQGYVIHKFRQAMLVALIQNKIK
jgi:predicted nucleic acid-binding Zn ribbon protein